MWIININLLFHSVLFKTSKSFQKHSRVFSLICVCCAFLCLLDYQVVIKLSSQQHPTISLHQNQLHVWPLKSFPDQSLMRFHLSRQHSVIWNGAGVCVTERERENLAHVPLQTAERRVHHRLYYTSCAHKREMCASKIERLFKDRRQVSKREQIENTKQNREINTDKERHGILSQEKRERREQRQMEGGKMIK